MKIQPDTINSLPVCFYLIKDRYSYVHMCVCVQSFVLPMLRLILIIPSVGSVPLTLAYMSCEIVHLT